MASKSLGTLTLDLVAKTAGFAQGMSKAERDSDKWRKKVSKDLDEVARKAKVTFAAVSAGSVALITAVATATKNHENEQAQLRAVLQSTGEAAGYNADQLNKMADSLELVSIFSAGEIVTAQTSLLAFTNIVGDQLPRALQAAMDMASRTGMSLTSAAETIGRALDVPSQGMAALSRQGFRFTESQKELVKFLEETGRSAEAQGLIFDALESTYGGAAQAARDTLGGALAAVKNAISGLLTQNEGMPALTENLNTLAEILRDPEVKEGFDTLVGGMVAVGSAAAKALPAVVNFTKWAAESFAALVHGPASDDIVRLEDKLKNLEKNLGLVGENSGMAAGIRAEIARTQSLIDQFYATAAPAAAVANQSGPARAPVNEAALAEEARKAAELAERQKKAAEERRKAAEASASAIAKELTALERAAAVWGMSADEIQVYDLRLNGATDAQIAHAESLQKTLSALKKQDEQRKDYLRLVEGLRTEEERRSDTLREQLAIIEAVADAEGRGADEAQRRAIAGAFTDAPMIDFRGPASGVLGEFSYLQDEQKRLEEWYATQLAMLEQYRQERADLSAEWDAQELILKQQHEEAMQRLEMGRWNAVLSGVSDILSTMQAMNETDSKKGRERAKKMAIAQATINAYMAFTGALASASSIPVLGWIMAPIAAAAALAAGMQQVNAIKGMAHSGIDSVPATGTWLLEKGERVTTAQTSAKLDATLERIRRDQDAARQSSTGQRQVVVNQTIQVSGAVDNRTANQIAVETARRQRMATARLG